MSSACRAHTTARLSPRVRSPHIGPRIIRAVGGWPDAIGEDIVLTWTMMAYRGLVRYEPCALGYTAAPEKLRP